MLDHVFRSFLPATGASIWAVQKLASNGKTLVFPYFWEYPVPFLAIRKDPPALAGLHNIVIIYQINQDYVFPVLTPLGNPIEF